MPERLGLLGLVKIAVAAAVVGGFLYHKHDQRERRRAREAAPAAQTSPARPAPFNAAPRGAVAVLDPAPIPVVPDDLAHLLPRGVERVYFPQHGGRLGSGEAAAASPASPGRFSGEPVEVVRPY